MTEEKRNLYLMIDPDLPPAEAFIPQIDPGTTLVTSWTAVSTLDTLIDTTIPGIVSDLGDVVSDKADKVVAAVSGNLAGLDVNGNLTDSGYADSDLLRKADATAKGDIFAAEGLGSVSPLIVGTNGQVLTAASGETHGLIWATPAAVITDHGGLDGLGDDDHSQYYNSTRGDARFHRMENHLGPIRHFTDFLGVNAYMNPPWIGLATSSGTIAIGNGDANHPGVAIFKSATGNNSGYYHITNATALLMGASEKSVFVFKTLNAAAGNNQWRAGWQDSTTNSDPTDGAWLYFDQSAGTIDGRRNDAGGGVATTATAFTYADATWYRGEIETNAAGDTITFSIYLCSTGALVWSSTLATLPTGVTGHGVVAWNTAPVAAKEIVHVDYMSIIINRTLVR